MNLSVGRSIDGESNIDASNVNHAIILHERASLLALGLASQPGRPDLPPVFPSIWANLASVRTRCLRDVT